MIFWGRGIIFKIVFQLTKHLTPFGKYEILIIIFYILYLKNKTK